MPHTVFGVRRFFVILDFSHIWYDTKKKTGVTLLKHSILRKGILLTSVGLIAAVVTGCGKPTSTKKLIQKAQTRKMSRCLHKNIGESEFDRPARSITGFRLHRIQPNEQHSHRRHKLRQSPLLVRYLHGMPERKGHYCAYDEDSSSTYSPYSNYTK